MKNLEPRRARFMRMRIALLALLLCAGAFAVVQRAFELQVERADQLRAMAEEQYLRDIRLSPKRGTIYDRNGAELAVSVDVESVWANPRQLRRSGGDPASAARRLSTLLGVDRERIEQRLRSKRYFVWIKRHVSPQQAAAVRTLELPGVQLSAEARRFYPNRELAAHLLGFANIDGKGIEGLELRLDAKLRGAVDSVPAIRDRRGHVVFSQQLLDDRAARGDDLVLSLDRAIQHAAERELELSVRTFEAHGGSIVAMDPRTGEVLAMANYPTFNPNDPGSAPASHRRNRAVTDRFEPGSTIKQFTVAGALAAGAVRANQPIDCQEGELEVAEYTIHDTHRWNELTPGQILAYSSNIGTAKIGMALGRARLYRVLRDFGFGRDTGIPLPGETGGILRHYKRWYEMDTATIAFGQGMSATALQLASAMGALANKGRLMEPVLVKRVQDARGRVREEFVPRVRRQVVPARVARLVSDMLTGVTGEGGTGQEAALDGYLVAGKTGTAQKADYVRGGYAEGKWTSSFVGFAPAEEPRIVVAVVIDEPVIEHYGGLVAGPAFRRVAEAALRHLGVPARHPQLARASKSGRKRRAGGEGTVRDEAREKGGSEAQRSAHAPGRALDDGERSVPDLSGLTARAALVLAGEHDLSLAVSGSGVVVSQVPLAGNVVARGTRVAITLQPPAYTRDDEEAAHTDESTGPLAVNRGAAKAAEGGPP